MRLRPGVLGGLAGMPADALVDQDLGAADLWRGMARLTDRLGEAATPRGALDRLESFVARSAGEPDRLVDEAVRNLMPWRGRGRYHDQAHLSRECRRLAGAPPGELLTQYGAACACGHDHAASYLPMLRRGDGRFVQERRPVRYVKDCGRAIALLMLAERLSHRVYNVSSGRYRTTSTGSGTTTAELSRPFPPPR